MPQGDKKEEEEEEDDDDYDDDPLQQWILAIMFPY